MPKHYEKITLEVFLRRLRSGGYANPAGARRAVGRMSTWSFEECEKAQEAIAEVFPGAPDPGKGRAMSQARIASSRGRSVTSGTTLAYRALKLQEATIGFLNQPHAVRLAVLEALKPCGDAGISCRDLLRLFKSAEEKLRKK